MSLTLKEPVSFSYEEKKSRFYLYAVKASSEEEAFKILAQIQAEHPKARHILYVYRLKDGKMGAEEDQEPVSSMHKALAYLEKKDLSGVFIAAVRYFGGVLLGAARLDRVYLSLVLKSLAPENLAEEKELKEYKAVLKSASLNSFQEKISSLGGKIISREFRGPETEIVYLLSPEDQEKI
jgi:putative IMPACT (imprinted ancient) family translation regulator